MGGADPSTGKEEAPPADWRCKYALTDSWWDVDAAWRLRLHKRRLDPLTDMIMYGPAEGSTAAVGTDFAAHEQALQPTPHSESGTSTGRAHNHVVRTPAGLHVQRCESEPIATIPGIEALSASASTGGMSSLMCIPLPTNIFDA